MKSELLKLIELLKEQRDKDKLENIIFYKNYFDNFFKKYPSRNFMQMSKITYEEVIYSLVLINNPENAIKCFKVLKQYEKIIFGHDRALKFSLLLNYLHDDFFQQLVKDANGKNPIKKMNAWRHLSSSCNKAGCKVEDMSDFIVFLNEYPNLVFDLKPFLITIMPDIWENSYNFYEFLMAFKASCSIIGAKKSKIDKSLKIMIKYKDDMVMTVLKYSNYLYSTYHQVVDDINKEIRRINLKNKNLDELIKLLDANEEIKNIDHIIELCPNDEIKALVIDFIIEHNKQYNLLLLEEYKVFKYNNDENLIRLFNKYGYQYDVYEEAEKNIIREKGYDKLENMFQKLKANQIKLKEKDLLYLDEELLDKIINYLNLGIFTSNFVEENITLLIKSFLLVENNIKMLSNLGINIVNYSNSLNLLFNDGLEKQINILKDYGLNIKRETYNISFLNDIDLALKIDFLIESGYYEQLIDSLDILNYSLDELKRLKIKQLLNLSGDLLIDANTLFLQDHFIDEGYLEILKSNNIYIKQLPDFLLSYKLNNYVLLINDVFVSIPRLINNLTKFDDLDRNIIWVCILYNGNYTLEEIEKLSKAFNEDKEPLLLVRR